MKKVIATFALSALMALCLAGCGGSGESSSSSSSSASSEAAATSDAASSATDATPESSVPPSIATGSVSAGDTYEGFYDEYSYRLQLETPILINEYNTQSAPLGNDSQAKSELCNEKIGELAKISEEGINKMAELSYVNGEGDSAYQEWSKKLNDVYLEQAAQINNAYIASV